MGANKKLRIRDSHQVTFDLFVCTKTGYRFRYAPEAAACERQDPDSLITPYSRVRISLPNIPTMHNRHGTVIGVEGPVVDKRFKIEQNGDSHRLEQQDDYLPEDQDAGVATSKEVEDNSVMTYRVTVEVDGHGIINNLYSDQVAELTEHEIRNGMKGKADESKKLITSPDRLIGNTPMEPLPAPEINALVAEEGESTALADLEADISEDDRVTPVVDVTNNFERGLAEGLGEDISDDDIDPDSISLDFDDDDALEFNG